jgi:hypothetical protein
MRLLWLLGGFLIGVSVGRNRGDISTPVFGACVLASLMLAGFAFWAGRRHQRSAVASAVAVAHAAAQAQLDAHVAAQSTAQAHGGHVQLVLAGGGEGFPAELRPVQLVKGEPGSELEAAVSALQHCERRAVGDGSTVVPDAVGEGRHASRDEADRWHS